MLVDELQKIIQLDQKITSLHKKLEALYQERSQIVQPKKHITTEPVTPKTARDKASDRLSRSAWVSTTYSSLHSRWEKYGLALPPRAQLHRRLNKAYDVLRDLRVSMPLVAQHMVVVVVPPKNALDLSKIANLRQIQGLSSSPDTFSEGLSFRQHLTGWKVLLIYADKQGLLPEETDLVAAGELNIASYLALSLQSNSLLDTHSWTLLPGNSVGGEVACVTFTGKHYGFELDDQNFPIGDNRVRPIAEIK